MTPQVARTVAELRQAVSSARAQGRTIALVPTMGALHKGHGALIDRAKAESGYVVVSIFVNPIQFDRKSDYERYARNWDRDLAYCGERGADLVFAPGVDEVYPHPQRVFVDAPDLSEYLCGMYRPGHFRGVATVVAKLFEMARPDTAYFGEKDAQQLAIVEAVASDLNMGVRIVPVATVREEDGLAVSSRNARLSPEHRRIAPVLYRTLQSVRAALAESKSPEQAKQAGRSILSAEPEMRVEYLEIVDAATMRPVEQVTGPVRIAAAAWLGETRLIDNLLYSPAL